jgi:pyruvate-formate lyase-activating enzyme
MDERDRDRERDRERGRDRERPWWWLTDAERAKLGLGAAVKRSAHGVLFGDSRRPFRLEIVARTDDAPVRLGPIALRLFGNPGDPRGRALLRAVVEILGPRLAEGFDPDVVPREAGVVAIPETETEPEAPRSGANTTIIDVPSVCDRACVFCQISLRPIAERTPRGADEDVDRAIAAGSATGDAVLFTGDDALSHPRIVAWIEAAARGGRHVTVIGPPRLGSTARMAPDLARAGLRKYQTALLGATDATHDRIGGREGALRAVREATAAMRKAGVKVELVTPLIRPILAELGAITALAAELADGGHTLLAYAPDSMVGTGFDAVVAPFDELRAALAGLAGARVSVDALPLCVLPEAMRARGGARLDRTDERLQVGYAAICGECELEPGCPGFATTVARAVGTGGLVALRRGRVQN